MFVCVCMYILKYVTSFHVCYNVQELLNTRDSLEEQLRELTLQLGHVEEQRLAALKDSEAIKVRTLLLVNFVCC